MNIPNPQITILSSAFSTDTERSNEQCRPKYSTNLHYSLEIGAHQQR